MMREENIRDIMKDSRLSELYPDFDKEAEWKALAGKLKGAGKGSNTWRTVMKAAAAVLVISTLGGYALYSWNNKTNNNNTQAARVAPAPASQPAMDLAQIAGDTAHDRSDAPPPVKGTKHIYPVARHETHQRIAAVTEPICNATQCALEICILQTMKCGNGKSTEISDCRTLEPDQAGQLRYKDPEVRTGCVVTVDEIRITRINTGETIIINSASQPASANDVMRCLTGEASCNMLAGMFETNCDNEPQQGKLKIDSKGGDVILQ